MRPVRPLAVALLPALLLACGPTDPDAAPPADARVPGHDFTPEPEAQPAPQPEPEPAPAPEPGPPVEPGADGVFRGRGSILLQISGEEPFEGGGQAVVDLLDAEGATLATHEAGLGLYPVEMAWTRQLWWLDDTTATQARVRLYSADVLIREVTVAVGAVPVVASDCDPKGFANRCADGAICLATALDRAGACETPQIVARAWDDADQVSIDLQAAVALDRVAGEPGILRASGLDRRVGQTVFGATQWRRVVHLSDEGDGALDVFVGPHRVTRVPVEPRPVRALDAACDPARLIDTCAPGTGCDGGGRCVAVVPPRLDAVDARRDADTVAFWLTGFDPDRDVDRIEARWVGGPLDGQEAPEGWLQVGPHLTRFHSQIDYDATGRFEGIWAFRPADPTALPAADGIEVVLRDAEDQVSMAVRADFAPVAPVDRAAGQACDALGVLARCTGGTTCDLVDGSGSYRCVEPAPGCADPAAWPAITEAVVMGDTATGVDQTRTTCLLSRGNLGEEQGFSLTAERAGVHRLTVSSDEYAVLGAIAVRRRCDLPGPASEIACSGEAMNGNGTSGPLSVAVELAAGEQVYVVVEATWVGGGPFTLEVERP